MEVACLVIPDFPVALARRDDRALRHRPIVVGGSPEEHAQVRACSQEARDAGVTIGTTLRRALALCPAATFLPWRETQVRCDEDERIVRVLEEQSPVAEAIEPGHVHFDVRGLARLAGCEDAVLLRRIQDVVGAASGLRAALAGADTVFHGSRGCQRGERSTDRGDERSLATVSPWPAGGNTPGPIFDARAVEALRAIAIGGCGGAPAFGGAGAVRARWRSCVGAGERAG